MKMLNYFLLLLLAVAFLPVSSAQDPAPNEDPAEPAVAVEDPMKRIKKLGGNEYSLDDIHFNSETGEVRFPARVNMTRDQIEYIIVTEKGKTHESLLSTKTSPFILNVVMLLCRYQASAEGLIVFVEREGPGGGPGEAPGAGEGEEPKEKPKHPFGGPTEPAKKLDEEERERPNNLLEVFIRYKEDGEEKEVLLDDWIFNSLTETSLKDQFWVYTGSDVLENGDFVAELEGSIFAIYVDRMAMFNNPIKGNDNDEIWVPNEKVMPAVDTPVEVIIRRFDPPKEEEAKSEDKKEEKD